MATAITTLEPTPENKAYEPYGVARQLFRMREREIVLSGPAGTGKSRACLEKINLAAMRKPIRGAIVRKVRKSLTQSAMVTFESKVLPEPSNVKFHTEDQEYRYPGGAIVAVAGLDDAEKIKSTEWDMVYVQEATELDEDDWGMLLRGLRNNVLPYQQLIADCNPDDPNHWLRKRVQDGLTHMLDTRHEDNPLLWDRQAGQWTDFGRTYIGTLDALKGYQYLRLRKGMWVAAEGMYFEDWDPQVHVVPERFIPKHWPRWVAVDYGFAVPFCALWFARDPDTEGRPIYVYGEAYGAGLRDEQQAELIVRRTRDYGNILLQQVVLDPSMFLPRTESGRPSIAQVYADHGVLDVTRQGIFPGMNNRKQGWAVVRRALAWADPTREAGAATPLAPSAEQSPAQPRLRIMRGRCPNLERTLPAMVHDPLDPEDVADKVRGSKTEDHAPDTLRYGLCAEAQYHPPEEPERLTFG